MKFSISGWRKTLSTLGVRVLGNRNSESRIHLQSVRLNAEVLEDRWTPSISLPMALADAPIVTDLFQALHLHLTQPADPASAATPDAESLQALLDGPNRIVDLGGQTWIVPTRLTIATKHSGKTIQNGTIQFTFQGTVPRIGGMEIIQNDRWWDAHGNSVIYPAGTIDLTLKNLVLDGDFPYDYGLQAQTESKADQLKKGYNLISTGTFAANSITLENVRFQNSGNSAIAGWFNTFIGRDISADRIAKHVIGLRGHGGTNADIDGLVVTNSGNVIDFHNDGSFFDAENPDVASLKNLSARNIRGRSKVAGNNWSVDGSNWSFEQDSVVNLNRYPAFDLSKHPRRFVVDGFVAINFPTYGIGTLGDTRTGGDIRFTNVYVRNSLSGIKVQQKISVVDSEFEGVRDRYGSSVPWLQTNNVDTAIQGDAYWAAIYDQIELLFATKNAEWGTDFVPRPWVPTSVQILSDSNEALRLQNTISTDQGTSEREEPFGELSALFVAVTDWMERMGTSNVLFLDPAVFSAQPAPVILAEPGSMPLRIAYPSPWDSLPPTAHGLKRVEI